MEYIKKSMVPWAIKYGQIAITGNDYELAKKIFQNFMGVTFTLKTFRGQFSNRHFIVSGSSLRLACLPFFSKLSDGDSIYIYPIDDSAIGISTEAYDLLPRLKSGVSYAASVF